jgi:hypothetical protein
VKTLFHSEPMAYDGSAIHAHWARRTFGIEGDCAVAFLGPCDVRPEEVVDMEEVVSGEPIRSREMVHVIVEHFGPDLENAVLRARLLAALAFERIREAFGPHLERRGDDLWAGERKLSVCVATVTPVSVKIHFGVNVTGKGAPVKAAGLEDAACDARAFAEGLLADYRLADEEIQRARAKVRGVR